VVEGYSRVVWCYRAVEVLAGVYSRLPLMVADILTLGADREPELVLDDPLLPLLSQYGHANPVETGQQYRHRKAQQVLLSPRGTFTEVLKSRGGTPLSLTLLPPGRTRIVAAKDGSIDHYEVDPHRPGDRIRPIEPDLVLWDRDPHPDNPYAGMTPLEAAGLTLETDHFARLFNRSYLANDDGVATIVGVEPSDDDSGELSEEESERIERKIGGNGVLDAGRTIVVDGKVTMVDVGRTPRDASYGELRLAGRDEISIAFYVPLSKMGDASGRTYANAGQEDDNWWPERVAPFADARAGAYNPLTDDGLAVIPDYSRVEALNNLRRKRREEMSAEVTAGLRTPLSYARRTGQLGTGDFPDVPGTRVLWRTGGVPIGDPADVAEAEKLTIISAPVAPPATGTQPLSVPPANVPTPVEGKRAARAHHTKAGPGRDQDDDAEDDRAALDAAVEGALAALATRQTDQALARLSGVKARRDTRYWNPPGRKTINPDDVADPEVWAQQAYDATAPLLAQGAAQAGVGTYDQLAAQGVDVAPEELPPEETSDPLIDALVTVAMAAIGTAPMTVPAAAVPIIAYLAGRGAFEAAQVIADAARARAERVRAALAEAQHLAPLAGRDALTPVQDAVRVAAGDALAWAKRNATVAVTAAVEGTRTRILTAAGDRVERIWRTRRDDKVRPAHEEAEGQVRRAAAPFDVGGEELRWPGDPLGSPENIINCVPPWQTVSPVGDLLAVLRAPYDGLLYTVTTRSGRVLSGTAQHPALTDRGWVGLSSLSMGDHLIGEALGQARHAGTKGDPAGTPDVQDAPTRADELFHAVAQAGNQQRVARLAVNLHGDLADGDVDVVATDCDLPPENDPTLAEQIAQFVFTEVHPAVTLPSDSPRSHRLVGVALSAARSVSRGSECPAVVGAGTRHAGQHGVTPTPDRHALALETSAQRVPAHSEFAGEGILGLSGEVPVGDPLGQGQVTTLPAQRDTRLTDHVVDPGQGLVEVPGDLADVLPFDVATDEIVSIDSRWYRGHVYTLHTSTGIYLTDGLSSRNCRCRVSYRIRRKGVPYVKALEGELEGKVFEEDKHPRGFHGRFGHVVKTEAEGLSDALEVHHAPSGPEEMTAESLHARARKGEKLAGRTVTLLGATSGDPYDVTLTREPQVHPDGIVLNFHRGYDADGELRVGQRKLEPDEVIHLHPAVIADVMHGADPTHHALGGEGHLQLPEGIRRGKNHVRAVAAARAVIGERPGRRLRTPENDSEVERYNGLIAINQEGVDRWKHALATGIVPIDNAGGQEGVKFGSRRDEYGLHTSRSEAQDYLDQYQGTVDRITAKRDEYLAFLHKQNVYPQGGRWEYDTDTGHAHLTAVLSAGKTLDAKATRRADRAILAEGVNDAAVRARLDVIEAEFTAARRARSAVLESLAGKDDIEARKAVLDALPQTHPQVYARFEAAFAASEAAAGAWTEAWSRRNEITRQAYLEVLHEVRPMGAGDTGGHDLLAEGMRGTYSGRVRDLKVGDRFPYADDPQGGRRYRVVQATRPDPDNPGKWLVTTADEDGTRALEGRFYADEHVELDPPKGWVPSPTAGESNAIIALRAAERFYPTSWIAASRGTGQMRVGHVERGFYSAEKAVIALSGTDADLNRVAVHELGHRAEYTVDGLMTLEFQLHYERTATKPGAKVHPRNELRQLDGYPTGEVAQADQYPTAYSGRVYGRGRPENAWEVFSTTIESLFGGSSHADEQMRQFGLGVLATLGPASAAPPTFVPDVRP
jgi:phage portal protein BeeE